MATVCVWLAHRSFAAEPGHGGLCSRGISAGTRWGSWSTGIRRSYSWETILSTRASSGSVDVGACRFAESAMVGGFRAPAAPHFLVHGILPLWRPWRVLTATLDGERMPEHRNQSARVKRPGSGSGFRHHRKKRDSDAGNWIRELASTMARHDGTPPAPEQTVPPRCGTARRSGSMARRSRGGLRAAYVDVFPRAPRSEMLVWLSTGPHRRARHSTTSASAQLEMREVPEEIITPPPGSIPQLEIFVATRRSSW